MNTYFLTVALGNLIIRELVEVDILNVCAVVRLGIGNDALFLYYHSRNYREGAVIELIHLGALERGRQHHQRAADTHKPFARCADFGCSCFSFV